LTAFFDFDKVFRKTDMATNIQKMSRGATVQRVALELGYESASGFVTMFRKTLRVAPARYMAERLRV
jgi:AraC-like DNA-binding protein